MRSTGTPPYQIFNVSGFRAVAAHQPVISEEPHFAWFDDRLCFVHLFDVRLRVDVLYFVDYNVVDIKSRQVDVEAGFHQVLKLSGSRRHVPSSQLRQPVVCQDISAALLFCQPLNKNARDRLHSELGGRFDSSVAGDDVIFFVDQARTDKSELLDAVFQLFDLTFRV